MALIIEHSKKPTCLICGKSFTRPLSHVWQKHGMRAREYKEAYGLDVKKGIATEEYKERMREHVFKNDTVLNLKKGAKNRFKKGNNVGRYKRSKQTLDRLKVHFKDIGNLKGRAITVEKIEVTCAGCGKTKKIYPRYLKENNNYCGVVCRNRANNFKRHNKNV